MQDEKRLPMEEAGEGVNPHCRLGFKATGRRSHD